MKDLKKIQEFFSKPLKEAKTGVDMAKKQLDALGVKYEMSTTDKVRPFKVIYKPVNKSDDFYDKFNKIVDEFNLKGFVKSSMSEAKSLTGGYPHKKTSGAGFEKIEITEPMDDATKNRMIKNFESSGWDAKPNNGGGITAIKKVMMEALMLDKYEVDFYPNEDNVHAYIEIPSDDPTSEDTIYIKGVGETEKEAFEDLEQNYKTYKRYGLYEAKSEDVVDTITMDIPLFLRMLEYAREDAEQDLDLHDVTEKANKLGKERGILQTDDYEEIVGATEDAPLDETTDYMKRRKAQDDYAVSKKDKPTKSTNPKYSGNTDYMKRRQKDLEENVAPNHDGKAAPFGSGYKPLEERISEVLNKINEELCPAGKAYIKRRQAAGEKSSAYLSGRAVKVCKGQMSGKAKKKTNESLINEGQKINQNLNNLLNKIKKDFNIDNEQI